MDDVSNVCFLVIIEADHQKAGDASKSIKYVYWRHFSLDKICSLLLSLDAPKIEYELSKDKAFL